MTPFISKCAGLSGYIVRQVRAQASGNRARARALAHTITHEHVRYSPSATGECGAGCTSAVEAVVKEEEDDDAAREPTTGNTCEDQGEVPARVANDTKLPTGSAPTLMRDRVGLSVLTPEHTSRRSC